MIRVLLAQTNDSVKLTCEGGLSVQTANGIAMIEAAGQATAVVEHNGGTITAALPKQTAALDDRMVIAPKGNSPMLFNGVRYSGSFKFAIDDGGALLVLNVLPMEDYLEGVVPHEMGNPGVEGFDALKTQAVAARTYALSKTRARTDQQYDVYSGVLDQVYGGLERQSRTTSAAVRDTRGRILEFDGQIVRAYYSACCGGHTSDIGLVWPDREAAAYLLGRADRDGYGGRAFCESYKKFRWRFSFTGSEIGDVLRKTLPERLGVSAEDVGALKDIRVTRRSKSGRVISLEIETSEDTFVVHGDAIRWILMQDVDAGKILPSVMFRLDKVVERDRVAFLSIAGGGNGHGVGMCQNGAISMARRGFTYQMILSHYYPGCEVTKAY